MKTAGDDEHAGASSIRLSRSSALLRWFVSADLPGPVGKAGAGGEGVRVLGAEDPLHDGQQRGVLVAGRGRVPRLPGPAGEVARGRPGCPGARRRETRSMTGSSAAYWSRAAAGSPASPVQQARLRGRPGCPGARRRRPARGPAAARRTGRGPRPDPPPARSSGRGCAGGQGVRVLGAGDPLADRQQRGELVAGRGRVPRLPGQAGEVGAGGQGVRVLGAEDPLADGQQRGELVAGAGRDPPPPRSSGRGWPGGQGVRVLRAQDPLAGGQQRGELVAGPGRIPRLPGPEGEVARAVRVSGCSAPRTRSTRVSDLRSRSRAAA